MRKILSLLGTILLSVPIGFSGNRSNTNFIIEDLSSYFEELDGCFILFDKNKNIFQIHNSEKSNKQVSPCSTFKIINSLIGLETGVLKDENTEFHWNGYEHAYDMWNQNHKLSTAIAYSVVWYYQELASRIGEERMQEYLNKLDYGNKDISGGLTNFWLTSTLKVSPMEQLEMLRRLFEYELPFSRRSIDIVKKIIILQNENDIILSGRTGGGMRDDKHIIGWFIGYVESNDNTYFFTTNIEGEAEARSVRAREITLRILRDKGIL